MRARSIIWTVLSISCLGGCGERPTGLGGVTDTSGRRYPYGMQVPEGAVLSSGPLPFDPATQRAVYSPPRRDADPPHWERLAPTGVGGGPRIDATSSGAHDFQGWRVQEGRGIIVGMDAQLNFTIPSQKVAAFYAPTALPSGGACIEATVAHYRSSAGAAQVNAFGLWNHCKYPFDTVSWPLFEVMNAAWRSKYVRPFYHADLVGPPEDMVYVQIRSDNPSALFPTSDCWRAYFYNFNLGMYEERLAKCGVSHVPDFEGIGWTGWEAYWGTYNPPLASCPSFPGISAQDNDVLAANGQWLDMSLYSRIDTRNGECWIFGYYSFHEHPASVLGMWHVHSPNNIQ